MSLMEKIKSRFKNEPMEDDVAQPPVDSPDMPKRFAIQQGEWLPWKGFIFQIAEVDEKGFRAELRGITKSMEKTIRGKA